MDKIQDLIQSYYPTIDEMPFCAALRDGRVQDRDAILRAETVELYRALNTRDKIQGIYKGKLRAAMERGLVTADDVDIVEDMIDDEGETEEHIDHLDMRYKLFAGTSVSRATTLTYNADVEAINNEWVNICEESDLFTLMAVTAGIEDWYAPLSGFFGNEYRKRGFTTEELELFIVHETADVEHSNTQFDILDRKIAHIDLEKTKTMLARTFATSRAYDAAKLKLAESTAPLQELLAA